MRNSFIYILLTSLFTFSFAYGNKIAVASKIKGLVEIIHVGQKEFTDLRLGTILFGKRL